MTEAITRLFDTYEAATEAVNRLEASGVPHHDISILGQNGDGRHAGGHSHGADDNDAAEGAGKGATTGGAIGAGAGLLAGLGMLAIPGLGPVVAAGWLVSTAVGAAVGAAAGGATGGILGALKDAGHSDEDAHVYAEGVRRGGTLVSVKSDSHAAIAREVLDRDGVDAASRGADYRAGGWQSFDDMAMPYDASQARMDGPLSESRSFGADALAGTSGGERSEQDGQGSRLTGDTERTDPLRRDF